MRKSLILFLSIMALSFDAGAQRVGLKTNLLYDATSTMNLGAEVALAKKWTLDVSGNLNPWTFSDNRKMKHWLVQPEVRWWTCSRFNGLFLAAHTHFAQYNWGGMLPWGFSNGKMFGSIENPHILSNRYQGWLAGAGVGVGWHWAFANYWGLEAELGLGYAYLDHDRYPCANCGSRISSGTEHYVGPTKAALSLIYLIK